jgi:hypothetical protein
MTTKIVVDFWYGNFVHPGYDVNFHGCPDISILRYMNQNSEQCLLWVVRPSLFLK